MHAVACTALVLVSIGKLVVVKEARPSMLPSAHVSR